LCLDTNIEAQWPGSVKSTLDWIYNINNSNLENLDCIKDLGVTFDSHLKFGLHINEKVNKAYSILGIIKRNFNFRDKDSF